MLLPDCKKVPIGRIAKTHGIKGELSVTLDSEFDCELRPGSPVILEIEGLDVPFFIAAVRPKGAESILLTLDEVKSEEDASALCGKDIYIYATRDMLSEYTDDEEADELTADKLTGYTIFDAGKEIGTIADVREIGPDCWYFVLDGSEKLIPIVDELISDINHKEKTIDMDLPAGLLEL